MGLDDAGGGRGLYFDGFIKGTKMVDAYEMKFSGSSSGDGVPLDAGQERAYPVLSSESGRTRKLRLHTE